VGLPCVGFPFLFDGQVVGADADEPERGPMKPALEGAIVAAAALSADQIFKNVMLYVFDFRALGAFARIPVTPFLDLVMVWNTGVSYGLFQAGGLTGTIVLTTFSLVAVGALSWWLRSADRRLLAWGLGLVIGGALGNVIDRVLYGAVADFFHFHAFGRGWYVFNVADAAITVGVVVLLVDAFARPEAKNSDREPVIRN
jgi:signal peptidase II